MTHRSKVDIDIHRGYNRDDNVTSQGFTKYYISKGVNVFITIENRADLNNYRLIKHSLERGYSIDTIKNGEYLALFKPQPPNKTTVTVFYSLSDITHETPLLVQFGEGYDYYTSGLNNISLWTKQNGMHIDHIKRKLDGQNCGIRDHHVIKISEKVQYTCPSCNGKPITVSPGSSSNYSCYTHTISGYVGELRYDQTEQTGLTLTGMISSVYVYWSQWEPSQPLLVYLSGRSSGWYQRMDIVSSKWKTVSKYIPTRLSDEKNILRIFIEYFSPTVTINLGEGRTISESGSSATYKDPGSQDNQETISLRREDVKVNKKGTKYIGFTHFVSKKPGFKVREIKHGNETTLESITSSDDILLEISAYYLGQDPSEEKKLLLVELQSQTRFKYYQRLSKNAAWTEYPIPGGDTKPLEDEPLKTKLDELYAIHFPSNLPTILGASVGSVGATGAAVGLGIWKGPSLIARLITRL